MLIAADVGNSGIKLGAFEGARLVRTARYPEFPFPRSGAPLVAVSVNEELLAEFLRGTGRAALVLGRDLPLAIENRYRDPEETGRDRLAAAAAAHEWAGGAAVVVDLGSAVTVDAVSAEGAFLGGSIAPGRRAFLAGLKVAAPALPPADRGGMSEALPRSTAEALRAGLEFGLAGLVDRLIEETRVGMGVPDAPVFLTGGDAEETAGRLRADATVEPHLVLHGVRILYDRAGGTACT